MSDLPTLEFGVGVSLLVCSRCHKEPCAAWCRAVQAEDRVKELEDQLVKLVAAAKSGHWPACGPGCRQGCQLCAAIREAEDKL